jgi:hypothetical protein
MLDGAVNQRSKSTLAFGGFVGHAQCAVKTPYLHNGVFPVGPMLPNND